VIRSYNQTFSA